MASPECVGVASSEGVASPECVGVASSEGVGVIARRLAGRRCGGSAYDARMAWSKQLAGIGVLALITVAVLVERQDRQHASFVASAQKNLGLREATAERMWGLVRTEFVALTTDPRIKGLTKEEGRRISGQVSGWMSPEDLLASWRIQEAWMQRDAKYCAQFWTGTVDPGQQDELLSRATDDELRAWFGIRTRASDRALAKLPRRWSTPAEAEAISAEGWAAILAAASEAEQQVLARARDAGTAVTAEDACAATRVLLARAAALPAAQRDGFLAVLQADVTIP